MSVDDESEMPKRGVVYATAALIVALRKPESSEEYEFLEVATSVTHTSYCH